MVDIRLGNGPDSWGVWSADAPGQPPWPRFLDELAAAGYEWTELGPPGYLPTDAGTLRRELEQRGLKPAAGFVMFPLEAPRGDRELRDDVGAVCARLAGVGAEFLVLIDDCYRDLFDSRTLAPATLRDDEWRALLTMVGRVSSIAAEHGLRTVFHPHAESHVEHEWQITRLLDDSDVALCFDVGHHAYCGGDAVQFVRDHHDRIAYLHLKNVDEALLQQVRSEAMSFAQAVAAGVFVEPWRGAVNFQDLIEVLADVDYSGFAVVEQDSYGAPTDQALPIARATREYLDELGFV
jgi:inosose dehydratase